MKMQSIVLIAIFLIPSLLFGQLKKDTQAVDLPTRLAFGQSRPSGLLSSLGLDPSRFHMSHSYQMSYLSGAGSNGVLGLYLNNMSYEFSKSLMMNVQWGMAHQPFGGKMNNAPQFMNGPFLSGAQLKYTLSDKLQIQVDYQSLPYWNGGYYHRSYFK